MRRYVCTVENGNTLPAEVDRILVPVDFSEESFAALSYAVDLAARHGATVDALHVWELPPYPAMAQWEPRDDDAPHRWDAQGVPTFAQHVHELATQRLDEMLTTLPHEGVEVNGILESGEAIPVISRLAPSYQLVVMGAHKDDAKGLLFGNVADRVAGEVSCPVVTVRAEEAAEHALRPSHAH